MSYPPGAEAGAPPGDVPVGAQSPAFPGGTRQRRAHLGEALRAGRGWLAAPAHGPTVYDPSRRGERHREPHHPIPESHIRCQARLWPNQPAEEDGLR